MTDRELMQQALAALELVTDLTNHDDDVYAAITALRERLAQPEQEPVGWLYPEGLAALKAGKCWTAYGTKQDDNNVPIYDAVAPRVEPRASESGAGFESLPASPDQQPVQEPVAEVKLMMTGGNAGIATRIVEIDGPMRERLRPGQLLYTTPPHRKPLTDEEIDKLPWEPHEGNPMTFAEGLRYFARAIEAAHGIKGQV